MFPSLPGLHSSEVVPLGQPGRAAQQSTQATAPLTEAINEESKGTRPLSTFLEKEGASVSPRKPIWGCSLVRGFPSPAGKHLAGWGRFHLI